jgi:hypothetical protein
LDGKKPEYIGKIGVRWLFLPEKFVHFSDIVKKELF